MNIKINKIFSLEQSNNKHKKNVLDYTIYKKECFGIIKKM